jgi:hypothetical protein
MKLLVTCFNKTTLRPNADANISLYDIERDPSETADLAEARPE